HGIPDPGYQYGGELDSAAVVVNEPVRRGRVTGTDLLPRFADAIDLDVYGMGCDGLAERTAGTRRPIRIWGDMPTGRLHTAMARRRCYLHPIRWTSLGPSLIEAMQLGMPVVGLATTEAVEAVPPEAGFVSTHVDRLVDALRDLAHEPRWARQLGKQARKAALARYGLPRFLADWDRLIEQAIDN
ncbi:MAG TPA: glycosyltransferase, partial [Pseudonocardiaceae bacterium]|nr:glycosyltransferase [Pseudonocardiaceae bacterium]